MRMRSRIILKDLTCTTVANSCLLVKNRLHDQWHLVNIDSPENPKLAERNLRNLYIFCGLRNTAHMSKIGISVCISFFFFFFFFFQTPK